MSPSNSPVRTVSVSRVFSIFCTRPPEPPPKTVRSNLVTTGAIMDNNRLHWRWRKNKKNKPAYLHRKTDRVVFPWYAGIMGRQPQTLFFLLSVEDNSVRSRFSSLAQNIKYVIFFSSYFSSSFYFVPPLSFINTWFSKSCCRLLNRSIQGRQSQNASVFCKMAVKRRWLHLYINRHGGLVAKASAS